MTSEPPANDADAGQEYDDWGEPLPKPRREADAEQEYDDWGEPLPKPRSKKDSEEMARQAWGSWRQDRELNRRKTLRALVGLVVVSVLAGVFAYACDALRGPRQLQLVEQVTVFTAQPPTTETEQLEGRLEAAGAIGPAAARYVGPPGDVLLVAGYGEELPPEVVAELLPAVLGADLEYEGQGAPMTCGPTAQGSRCVWKEVDIVGGTAGALPPEQLERISRDLRAGGIRR